MKNHKRGFTLIELLVVVTVIALTIGVVAPNLSDLRKKSRDARRKADLRNIAQALELYKLDQNPQAYPTGTALPFGSGWVSQSGTITYMKKIPQDPLGASNSYRYEYVNQFFYYLGVCLENEVDPDIQTTSPIANLCPVGVLRYYIVSP